MHAPRPFRFPATGPLIRQTCLPIALAVLTGLGLATGTTPAQAQSQYQWADENGRKVYSDVPPPPGSRVKNLTRRGERQRPDAAPAVGDGAGASGSELAPVQTADGSTPAGTPNPAGASGAAVPGKAARAPSVADQEMAFRKRLAEKAETEQKQSAKAEEDQRVARACEDGKASLRSLESGQRISRTTASGEREFISDAERDGRIRDLRSDLASRC